MDSSWELDLQYKFLDVPLCVMLHRCFLFAVDVHASLTYIFYHKIPFFILSTKFCPFHYLKCSLWKKLFSLYTRHDMHEWQYPISSPAQEVFNPSLYKSIPNLSHVLLNIKHATIWQSSWTITSVVKWNCSSCRC